jgi:hypothetical protein
MTFGAVTYYTLLSTPFRVQLVMLTLQVGAYRRHGHVSFLLLTIGTVCGFLFLTIPYAHRWWDGDGMPVSFTWFVISTMALLAQGVLAVWGTALLFKSYGALAAADPRTTAHGEAPKVYR